MRFILYVQGGSDLHFAQGAVAVINKGLREQLRRRRAIFLGLKAYEPELVYMEYTDGIDWLESFEDGNLAVKVETEHVLVNPPGVYPTGTALRIECETCVIDQHGVYWSCLVKHTEVWLETKVIPWDLIDGKE
jgi:hypothetical protein